jgi:hypothetical protein
MKSTLKFQIGDLLEHKDDKYLIVIIDELFMNNRDHFGLVFIKLDNLPVSNIVHMEKWWVENYFQIVK